MEGYDERTYGDAFSDVYDDWYADVSDVGATVATLVEMAGGGRVLELGVGTGRIALPLAEAGRADGIDVIGIDTSEPMLARLRERDPAATVDARIGDMRGPLPDGPFSVVVVAYNTLFNLPTIDDQEACLRAVADVLAPGGSFVVEAFVPGDAASDSDVSLRSMTADRVVLSISRRDAVAQRADGQFVEFTEAGGVRLRPWSILYRTPEQLDAAAAAVGLSLEHRWESFDRSAFTDESSRHVSVYRSAQAAPIGAPGDLS